MNGTDFQRAAGGRKIKFSFTINLRKGRLASLENPTPLAKDFAESLQGDEITRQLTRLNDYELTLTNSFQLVIKNTTAAAAAPDADQNEGETSDNE
jgi:hypothetical protein